MRFSQHFRMSVTKRGEKELRLGAFISRSLQSLSAAAESGALQPGERAVLVIARSAQSPVVKSLGAVASDIARAGCIVRMILARADRAGLPDALFVAQAAGLDCEVRRVRNPGLMEAHEQLVIGSRTCWMGDSMRRDPAISDAYESFVEDCPAIAATAASTFERLWLGSEPLPDCVAIASVSATPKAIKPVSLLARRS